MQRVIALTVFLGIASAAPAFAGTTGVYTGHIVDGKGAPVGGMTVAMVSASDRCVTRTNERGYFACMTLLPDIYTLSAEKDGYMPIDVAGFPVMADTAIYVPLHAEYAIKCQCVVRSAQRSVFLGISAAQDVYLVQARTVPVRAGRVSIGDMVRFVPGVAVP
ncbi:MAG TPA: carboxypeptidase-like regulatory domain-containing protein [Candidatus Aquilonibacter sp.]|nr:carboxypeptidase-like regulatory domain-containing protein [Candidatus Aquilonibacter sp.]